MPLLYWLFLCALLPLPAAAALSHDEPLTLLAFATMLLLVVVLSLHNRKLLRGNKAANTEQQVLKELLTQSAELIAVLDTRLQPTYLNPALATLTPASNLLLFADEQSDTPVLAEIAQHGHWQGEVWIQPGNNEPRRALALSITRHASTGSYLLIGHDISACRQKYNELGNNYIHDPDTGLFTPLLLNQFIQTAINSSTASQPHFAVLLVKYNQVLSYVTAVPQGNISDVIHNLGAQLQQYSNQGAVIARYNTDTVAILIPAQLCAAQIEVNLNRMGHNIMLAAEQAALQFKQSALQTYIGISIYPLDGANPATLLSSASAAICGAARLGRNNLQFANSSYQLKAPEYLALEAELLKAQQSDEFEVYYQPRLSIGSNRVIGYEALLRWHNPRRGILAPQSFLNIADETGLIIALDKLVFSKCCQQLSYWQQTGMERGRIAVNISSLSFRQHDFVSTLQQQLATAQLSAEQFELELDEDIFLQPDSTLSATLQQLITLGFHLTLDNFGQGIASLSVLRDHPLHSLKIAQSFIKDMEHNEQQRNITASLIRLASYLQLGVVATGIENEMQAYLLHVMGCDTLQGHLFSKPLPASEIPALLARENRLLRKEVS